MKTTHQIIIIVLGALNLIGFILVSYLLTKNYMIIHTNLMIMSAVYLIIAWNIGISNIKEGLEDEPYTNY